MKIKQKILIISSLSFAAVTAIGYLTKLSNKKEENNEVITNCDDKEQ